MHLHIIKIYSLLLSFVKIELESSSLREKFFICDHLITSGHIEIQFVQTMIDHFFDKQTVWSDQKLMYQNMYHGPSDHTSWSLILHNTLCTSYFR